MTGGPPKDEHAPHVPPLEEDGDPGSDADLERVEREMRRTAAIEAPPEGADEGTTEADPAWNALAADWGAVGAELRRRWPDLDDADLDWIGGDRERFLNRLQRYGAADHDDAERQLRAWLAQRGRPQ